MNGLNAYDYGARMLDAALPVWDRVDPLAEKYYNISPYAYCAGNPVKFVDPDGRDVLIWYTDKNGEDRCFRFNGRASSDGTYHIPNNQFVKDFVTAYVYDVNNGGGDNLKEAATNSKYNIEVVFTSNKTSHNQNTIFNNRSVIYWNPKVGLQNDSGGKISAATILEHEFAHAVDWVNNPQVHNNRKTIVYDDYDNKEEKRVITGAERKTALANRESVRNNHRGLLYNTINPTSTKTK